MKIPEIKFKSHPILSNLHIDFRKDVDIVSGAENQDNIYQNIIFVGENGVGKSTLLQELHNYGCSELKDIHGKTIIKADGSEYIVDKINKIQVEVNTRRKEEGAFGRFESKLLRSDIKYQEGLRDLESKFYSGINSMSSNVSGDLVANFAVNRFSPDDLKRIFSNDRMAHAFAKGQEVRMHHSMRARTFDEMHNPKKVGVTDYLDGLSSGEQEIVIRLLYLISNSNQFTKYLDFVLVDEPENSLHPKWQLKILEYYKNLFECQGGYWIGPDGPIDKKKRVVQLFVATHSENILKSAMEQGGWLIIRMYRDKNNKIASERVESSERRLPNLTFAEIRYLVFGISTTDYHNELYGQLQVAQVSEESIKKADSFIKSKRKLVKGNLCYKTIRKHKNGTETIYETLPTYIRNKIHHPENNEPSFTDEQLEASIKLLRELLK